jgi:hypothetical protein
MTEEARRARSRPRRRQAAIPETGLTDIIELSLRDDSYLKQLFPANDPVNTGVANIEKIAAYLNLFWRCVRRTWPDVWTKPTSEQRLTHKAGLLAMTQLMPLVMHDVDPTRPDAGDQILRRLEKIKGIPWDGSQLREIIKVGRKTDADILYRGIQTLYQADPPLTRLTLRDASGKEFHVDLAGTTL